MQTEIYENTRVCNARYKWNRNTKSDTEDLETYETIDEADLTYENPATLNRTNVRPVEHHETLADVGTVKISSDNPKSSGATYTKHVCVFITVIVTVCISISTASLVLVLRYGGNEDGAWNTWESLGSCSVSCDVGMQTRNRNCSGPTSADKGRQCFGTDIEYRLCTTVSCNDGGWSVWGSWDICSASCEGGIRARLRTCTNPSPSLLGRNCDGNNAQVETCNRQTCKESLVVFNAKSASVTNSSSHTVIFTSALLNEGNAYNMSNGHFTAPVSGIYQFNVHLCFVQKKL